jgi:hypothetical protein
VDAEMARGVLPGALALSAKFGPVVQRVAQRCADAARQFVADPAAFSERVRPCMPTTPYASLPPCSALRNKKTHAQGLQGAVSTVLR